MHRRLWYALALLASSALLTGCSLCQGIDDSYGYYGGLYQRPDAVHGRAGSILSGTDYVAEEDVILDEGSYYE